MNFKLRGNELLSVEIGEDSFVFNYYRSSNGKYMIAFSEDDSIPSIGNYFLLKNNILVTHGKIKRPNDGKVGDNGNFILNDWLGSKALSGIVHAFNENGQQLLAYKLKANLLGNSISRSGRYIIFQTANSNNSDSNVMHLYDLSRNSLVWKQWGGRNWPVDYEINDEKSLVLIYKIRESVTLDWTGKIWGTDSRLDTLPWVDER